MSLNDAFRVIDSKTVSEDLNLSTEIQFSTQVAHLSAHPFFNCCIHYRPSYFLPSIFHNTSLLFLPKRLWKWASKISFGKYKRKVVLLVIYLLHYDSSKSTLFIWHLEFSWLHPLSIKLKFFVSCNIILCFHHTRSLSLRSNFHIA